MKAKQVFSVMFFITYFSFAQVGIGNANPEATLDISATNTATPAANDGILIPRIDEFPATAPTVAQDGMMVFVTGNGTPSKGFYYWNNSTSTWLILDGAKAINELSDGKSDIDGTNDGSSIFLGINAGANDDSSDNRNIGIGLGALTSNTTGNDNIAIGNHTLASNISGFSNIGIGREVLYNNLSNGNIGIGFHTLFSNTTGSDNMAIGFDALYSNTTGVNNNAYGSQALRENTIGFFNNALGRHSLQSNISGAGNTAMGHGSLRDNIVGNDNTAVGSGAGDNVNGNNNVFIGHNAGVGLANSTNSDNVVIGPFAGSGANYNNRLYVDNSNTTTPLVYGEFDNNILRVNGTLHVNDPSGSGYQFPTTDGAPNQILQTDGSGTLGWVNNSTNDKAAVKIRNSTNVTGYSRYVESNLIFDTAVYNFGGGAYDGTTGTYTVPYTGVYNITAAITVSFNSSPDNYFILLFRTYVNGFSSSQGMRQDGAIISDSYAQTYSYNFHRVLNAGDLLSFRIIPGWDGTSPSPYILGGTSTATSNISIVKVY